MVQAGSQLSVIEKRAFRGCSPLTKFSIPRSVERILAESFSECKRLAKLTANADSQLSVIEYAAFRGCSTLTQFSIPTIVTAIPVECSGTLSGIQSMDND
jgi:hypothetical protein